MTNILLEQGGKSIDSTLLMTIMRNLPSKEGTADPNDMRRSVHKLSGFDHYQHSSFATRVQEEVMIVVDITMLPMCSNLSSLLRKQNVIDLDKVDVDSHYLTNAKSGAESTNVKDTQQRVIIII